MTVIGHNEARHADAESVAGLQEGFQLQYELMGLTLTPVRADRLSLLFGYLFHLGAFIAISAISSIGSDSASEVQSAESGVAANVTTDTVWGDDPGEDEILLEVPIFVTSGGTDSTHRRARQ